MDDAETIHFLRSDPLVNQFIKRDQTKNIKEASNFIGMRLKDIADGNAYYWSILLSDEQTMVGTICLWNISTDRRSAEVGYELHPAFQNQGYMYEALSSVINFAFDQLGLVEIEAFTHRDNTRSKKLLAKHQFQLQPNRTDENNPHNQIFLVRRKEDLN